MGRTERGLLASKVEIKQNKTSRVLSKGYIYIFTPQFTGPIGFSFGPCDALDFGNGAVLHHVRGSGRV